jgi:hypothetical protein
MHAYLALNSAGCCSIHLHDSSLAGPLDLVTAVAVASVVSCTRADNISECDERAVVVILFGILLL